MKNHIVMHFLLLTSIGFNTGTTQAAAQKAPRHQKEAREKGLLCPMNIKYCFDEVHTGRMLHCIFRHSSKHTTTVECPFVGCSSEFFRQSNYREHVRKSHNETNSSIPSIMILYCTTCTAIIQIEGDCRHVKHNDLFSYKTHLNHDMSIKRLILTKDATGKNPKDVFKEGFFLIQHMIPFGLITAKRKNKDPEHSSQKDLLIEPKETLEKAVLQSTRNHDRYLATYLS